MMRIDTTTPEPVTLALRCDTADPEEKLRWSIRPLTGPELDTARATAGPVPRYGQMVMRRIVEASKRPPAPEAAEAAPDDAEAQAKAAEAKAAKAAAAKAAEAAEAQAVDALSTDDRAAYESLMRWCQRLNLGVCCAGLVAVDGEPLADPAAALASIRPASVYGQVVSELADRITELSELDPKGRALYVSLCGCTTTPAAAGGAATTATDSPPCSSPGDGAAVP